MNFMSKNTESPQTSDQTCPKCGAELSPVEETPTGKKLQRCSKGSWNAETRKVEGCPFIKWIQPEPEQLDEKCPKCGAPLVLTVTRYGKKLKKCSTNKWDKEKREATGCDYVEWLTGKKEELDEACPKCGARLVMMTTAKGKKMKKCSTGGWDREKKEATGCDYVEWLNGSNFQPNGDENFPEHEA